MLYTFHPITRAVDHLHTKATLYFLNHIMFYDAPYPKAAILPYFLPSLCCPILIRYYNNFCLNLYVNKNRVWLVDQIETQIVLK